MENTTEQREDEENEEQETSLLFLMFFFSSSSVHHFMSTYRSKISKKCAEINVYIDQHTMNDDQHSART